MNDEQQLTSRAKSLRKLIEQTPPASCAEITNFIKENPRVLVEGIYSGEQAFFYPAPLNYALFHNNANAVEAILTVLTDKNTDYASIVTAHACRNVDVNPKVAAICKAYYPLDNVMYPTSDLLPGKRRVMPHTLVKTEKMLRLLHRFGYNLRVRTAHSNNTYDDVSRNLVEGLMSKSIPLDDHATGLFRAALELAINQKEKKYSPRLGVNIDIDFANYLFTKMVTHGTFSQWYATVDKTFEIWARAGLDFRDVLDQDPYHYPGLIEVGEKPDGLRAQQAILKFTEAMADRYLAEPAAADRNECALAACAGGYFPKLLGGCLEKDKTTSTPKELPQLISHLTDDWKDEYRQMIRHAAGSSVRTAMPAEEVRQSQLDHYAHDLTFSPGRA